MWRDEKKRILNQDRAHPPVGRREIQLATMARVLINLNGQKERKRVRAKYGRVFAHEREGEKEREREKEREANSLSSRSVALETNATPGGEVARARRIKTACARAHAGVARSAAARGRLSFGCSRGPVINSDAHSQCPKNTH